jgi:hypothetical protein
MSSEESEGELRSKNRLFHIKVLPWRHPRLTVWLHRLDTLTNSAARSPRFRQYPKRNRQNSLKRSSRPAVDQLPASFYCTQWLAEQSEYKRRALNLNTTEVTLPYIPGGATALSKASR